MERQDLTKDPEGRGGDEEKQVEALLARFRPAPPAPGAFERVLRPARAELERPAPSPWASRGLIAVAAGLLILVLCSCAVDGYYERLVEGYASAAAPPAGAAPAEEAAPEQAMLPRPISSAGLLRARHRLVLAREGVAAHQQLLREFLRNGS